MSDHICSQRPATSASSSTVRPTCQQSAQQRLPADETQCPPSTVRKPRQTPSRRRIDELYLSNNSSTPQKWHAIKHIAARRRGRGGIYLYQVQYLDDSKAWLPACDIEPSVVRAFNARKRRHRLWTGTQTCTTYFVSETLIETKRN